MRKIKVAWFNSKASMEDVISTNGVSLDEYCTKCITDETFGNYTLDLEFILNKNISDYFYKEAILKVLMDYGYEYFQITKVVKSIKTISVTCRQLTEQNTMCMWLDDVRPTNLTGLGALNYIINNSKDKMEIMANSDIEKVNTSYYVRKTVYEAINTDENSFLNRWGGEIQYRGYSININKKIGQDNGVVIRERKNLTGFDGTTNLDNLVTRGLGEGYNGIVGNYIDSPLIKQYKNVYTHVFNYSNIKLKTDESSTDDGAEYYDTLEDAQKRLNELVREEFSKNHVDQLQAEYNINFTDLSKADEYKEYSKAETVNLGDTVRVITDTSNVDISLRVIEKKYNILKQKTEEIKLSTETTSNTVTLSKVLSDITDTLNNSGKTTLANYVNAMIKNGNDDTYVTVKNGELLLMDNKDINLAKNVIRGNKNGIASSTTGYYGDFEYGFTIDGKINASMITTGILTAILIQSLDGSCTLDLNAGTFTSSKTYENGKTYETIFKDGMIQSNHMLFISTDGGDISIKKNVYDYTTDKFYYNPALYLGGGFYPNKKEFLLTTLSGERVEINAYSKEAEGDYPLAFLGNANFSNNVQVKGDFKVLGNKNCVQQTESYGDILFYSTEDVNSLLTYTDIDNTYKTTLQKDNSYSCKINIDEVIKECINTEMNYNVYITKLSFGDYYIETNKDYFIVYSDKELTFKYKLEGRRKNFEDKTLERSLENA